LTLISAFLIKMLPLFSAMSGMRNASLEAYKMKELFFRLEK